MHWALVTGGTDGIGKAITTRLARLGLGVVIVGSNAEKGEAAVRSLREETGNEHIHFERADLGHMREVQVLAATIKEKWPRLHYLVHCAGVVRGRRTLTVEGIETNFAVSYLNRFSLTQLLLPLMAANGERGSASRILVIGGAAQNGTVHYEDVNLARNFSPLTAVAQFCEANDVFVIEQARRIEALGWTGMVTVSTLKVGAVRTNIRKQFPLWMKIAVPLLIDPFLSVTSEIIAASAQDLLLAPEYEGLSGALFTQIKRLKPTSPGRHTRDLEEGRRLWDLSERLVARALARPDRQS